MTLSLAKAALLKPEIKLARALFECETVLSDDQKTKLSAYSEHLPLKLTDVMRSTTEIDRYASGIATLNNLASTLREEVSLASKQAQQNDVKELSDRIMEEETSGVTFSQRVLRLQS